MPRRSVTVRFTIIFVVLYGLLLAPWPGWTERYSGWLGRLGQTAFSRQYSRWIVQFDPIPRDASRPLDLRIMLGNRELIDANGEGPASIMDIDARGVGWVPTALLVALVIATPLPWRRRVYALAIGLVCIHACVLLAIGIHLWNGAVSSTSLHLLTASPLLRALLGALDNTLVTQMGPGFVVATALWLAATCGVGGSWWEADLRPPATAPVSRKSTFVRQPAGR